MSDPVRTFDAHVAIGRGSDWLVDLDKKVGSYGIPGRATPRYTALVGEREKNCVLYGLTHSVVLNTLLSGADVDMIRDHQFDAAEPNVAIANAVAGRSLYAEISLQGMPLDSPSEDIVSESLDLPLRGSLWRGQGALAATEFTLDSANQSVALGGAVVSGSKLLVWVQNYAGPGAGVELQMAGRTAGTVSADGFYEPPVPTADVANATIAAAAALGANQTIKGLALVMDEWSP